jgi:hypothetical protein
VFTNIHVGFLELSNQTLRHMSLYSERPIAGSCVGVLVISVLVFPVFCIVSFMYIYSYLLLV